MEFRTVVKIQKSAFQIEPLEPILFVGSCFADNIGQRFREEHFPVTVNPYGVMYNPASILHSVQRICADTHAASSESTLPRVVFFTLGTNRVYRLKETGEIVDNCQKRPHHLFQEEELTIPQCVDYLVQAVDELHRHRPDVQVVLTVSPIRYAKYGFHGSQLSKATLLLAVNQLVCERPNVTYFPAYEIVLDELRDYRFYQPDMIHPSGQSVEYIWQKLVDACFSERAKQFLDDWAPVKRALNHRPFDSESDAYVQFINDTHEKEKQVLYKYINKV